MREKLENSSSNNALKLFSPSSFKKNVSMHEAPKNNSMNLNFTQQTNNCILQPMQSLVSEESLKNSNENIDEKLDKMMEFMQ